MRPGVRYLMIEEKERSERVSKPLLIAVAKPWLPKQCEMFKCQTWFKITKKFAKKCLDLSSL